MRGEYGQTLPVNYRSIESYFHVVLSLQSDFWFDLLLGSCASEAEAYPFLLAGFQLLQGDGY